MEMTYYPSPGELLATAGCSSRVKVDTLSQAKKAEPMTKWDRIVGEHGPKVFRIAQRLLGSIDDAEDVMQEVFCEAYQLQRRETVNNWAGLLQRIATNRALDCLRRRKPSVELNGREFSLVKDCPAQIAVSRELAQRLRDAVAQLPQQQAAVFCLRYFDDYSSRQISETLNLEPSSVSSSLHKARVKLKSLLSDFTQGDES